MDVQQEEEVRDDMDMDDEIWDGLDDWIAGKPRDAEAPDWYDDEE